MKKVVKKDHEKLTSSNIAHVISLLESEKPITKKAACEILNISYNTTRLSKIIEEWKIEKAYSEERRAKNRGKPAAPHEIQNIIEQYLGGDNASEIAKRLYRPVLFVQNVIERVGVPTRPVGDDRYKEDILPEACVSESFAEGDIVWSAKWHRPARIIAELTLDYLKDKPGISSRDYLKEDGSRMYLIYIMEPVDTEITGRFARVEKGGRYSYAYAYKLGKLEHLKEFGINLEKL